MEEKQNKKMAKKKAIPPLTSRELSTVYQIVDDHKLRLEADMKRVKTMTANDLLWGESKMVETILKKIDYQAEKQKEAEVQASLLLKRMEG